MKTLLLGLSLLSAATTAWADRLVSLPEFHQFLKEANPSGDCQILKVDYQPNHPQFHQPTVEVRAKQKSTQKELSAFFTGEVFWTNESSTGEPSSYWIWSDRKYTQRAFPFFKKKQLKDYASLKYDTQGKLIGFELSLWEYQRTIIGKWYWGRIEQVSCSYE